MKLFDRPMPTAVQDRRYQLNWGIVGALIAVVILGICGYIFVFQPGTKVYSADFKEAQAIRSGVDVRVAGISVGSVSDVELLDDRVRVKFRVDNEIFLGDATTASMKMLTTVGGYYMALTPMGTKDLGDKPIPGARDDAVQPPGDVPAGHAEGREDPVDPHPAVDGPVERGPRGPARVDP
ncbi:MlaD family protein [Tsukamurella sp. PLM1]|uniref:MlaD family protein n=1 Tax=Tsukamurella sp. PLM1 TaxID=2929795 RepID=UPI0020C10034|nr:MlaD family protein [Tsukamurella sp. PLM1]